MRILWLVRHGESAGNAARDAARAAGSAVIDLASRDMDVPLSALGERQAHALGGFFGGLAPQDRPTALVSSPYVRARRTAEIAMRSAGIDLAPSLDERLREREFGWLDGLTALGIEQRFPDEAGRRARIGKFYHRPPGGESWCDVFLRVRSAVDSLRIERATDNVVVVAHQVVVMGFRYVLESLTEAQILGIDRAGDVANCSVTTYSTDGTGSSAGLLVLRSYNEVSPLVVAGEPVTRSEDVPVAPR